MSPRKRTTLTTLVLTIGTGLCAANAHAVCWTDDGTPATAQPAGRDGSNVQDLVAKGPPAPNRTTSDDRYAIAARSCRNHGAAGELYIDMGANGGVEPRVGGINKLQIDLDDAGAFGGGVAVTCNPTWAGAVTVAGVAGNTVTLQFSPALPDQSACVITLDCAAEVCVRTCEGDLNRSGDTNTSDASQVKLRLGQTPTNANCHWDLNLSGDINTSDYSQIKLRFGKAAPECWQPRIGDYSNSGCLPARRDASRDDPYPCPGDDQIQLTVEGNTLHVLHTNATYNCCPDDILISLTVEGSLLRLTEEELDQQCYCICCYDVEATVVELPPGEYTVEFCWYDYQTDGQRCYVEDIVIP